MGWFPCGCCGTSPYDCFACDTGTRPDQVQIDISGVTDASAGCGTTLTTEINASHVLDFPPYDTCAASLNFPAYGSPSPAGCETYYIVIYAGGGSGGGANWQGQIAVARAASPPFLPTVGFVNFEASLPSDCSAWSAETLTVYFNSSGLDFTSATFTVTSL